MYVASDGDLQASLRLADERYEEVQATREAQRLANWKSTREAMAISHLAEEKA